MDGYELNEIYINEFLDKKERQLTGKELYCKLWTIVLFCFYYSNCYSQSPIYDISEPKAGFIGVRGAYYKDTNNLLNGYDGTYLYNNGNTSLKLVLQKKVMSSMNNFYYEDLVIGEYQYIKDGIEKVNTLDKLAVDYTDQSKHNIDGNQILIGTKLGCYDCTSTERRLRLGFLDGVSRNIGEIEVRKTVVNGRDGIRVKIWWNGPIAHKEGAPMPLPASIGAGEYILIKQ
jgi:hypothetical protein